ncbi:MAG: discoidin domain-containing protein [Balneola sp.]
MKRLRIFKMRETFLLLLLTTLFSSYVSGQSSDRILFNGKEMWLNGGNVAWNIYARDIGPGETDFDAFKDMFEQVQASGANTMRLWVHTTGAHTPEWDDNNTEIVGPGEGTIEDLRTLLNMAEDHNITMMLCLWAHGMLNENLSSEVKTRNHSLLASKDITQTYIDNALIPMVEELGDHPALLTWEIFNEPEGMATEFGFNGHERTPMVNIQRFVNQAAGAIRRAQPNALVSNGTHTFNSLAVTSVANSKNYYSDEELISIGGDSLGTLDYYMVHYYASAPTQRSPFHNTYDSWGLDKPVVVGEVGVIEPDFRGLPGDSLYQIAYDNGYAGVLSWQWVDWYQNRGDFGQAWLNSLEQMKYMSEKYPEIINIQFTRPRIDSFEARFSEIEAGGATELSWDVKRGVDVSINGEPVDSIGSMIVRPNENITYTLIGIGTDASTDTAEIEIHVLPAESVNRAFAQNSRASTFESCCGTERTSDLAFDGDLNTYWSSAWSGGSGENPIDPNLDGDPDKEWIDVELEYAIELSSVTIHWGENFSTEFEVLASLDGVRWNKVYTETNGDGGMDSIRIESPTIAKYVRMNAFERNSTFGHNISELVVRGPVSLIQPASLEILSPQNGAEFGIGSQVEFEIEARDDGTIEYVALFANGDSVAVSKFEPYPIIYSNIEEGATNFYLKTVDDDGLVVYSDSVIVFGSSTVASTRLEAEEANLIGNLVIQWDLEGASKGAAVLMRQDAEILWDNLDFPSAKEAEISVRYILPFNYKKNFLLINGQHVDTLEFELPLDTWMNVSTTIELTEAIESISIGSFWGFMTFDYVDVTLKGISVSNEDDIHPTQFSLQQNYPNPFNPSTNINYSIPQASNVELTVYSITGQKVATLIQEAQNSGQYSITWNASDVASGLYLYRLKTDFGVISRKMVLIK